MPDSYVVQIYRRDPAKREMTGTVERVGNGGRTGFASADELWKFLVAGRPERSARRKARDGSKGRGTAAPADATSNQPKEDDR